MRTGLAGGLHQEWADDGRIVILTVNDTSMETLDTWAKTVQNTILAWPSDQPYLLVHDYSQVDLLLSTYIRRKSEELAQLRPELKGKVAIIFKKSVMAHLAQVALNTLWNKGYQARQRKVFFQREEALQWLME